MKKFGVIVNTKRPHADAVLAQLKALAAAHGFGLFAEDEAHAALLGAQLFSLEKDDPGLDVVLALGGDGTVLYTARKLHGLDVPIMGINLGSLGFLTSVNDQSIAKALEAIATGNVKIARRAVAESRIYQGDVQIGTELSLNDIVLGWGASSRIVTLRLTVDDDLVGTFMCDGMMVSTPTGSTGHSLSAGGPILHPGVGGFVINVICPHTLSSRPLVVPDKCRIVIEVIHCAKELILSIDGQDEYRLQQDGRIEIGRSAHDVKFMQMADHSYFSVLSQKLHWRGSSL